MPSRPVTFVVPGDLDAPTGGYIYDKRVIEELGRLGFNVTIVSLGPDYPDISSHRLEEAKRVLLDQPSDPPMIIDGLAFGAMGSIASDLARDHRIIALVHHPLALETGLSEEDAERLKASEINALSHASQIIVTSPATRDTLIADYLSPDRNPAGLISVVTPGFDRPDLEKQSRPDAAEKIFRILSVGSIIQRKGHDILVNALSRLSDIDWRLTIVGDMTASAEALADVRAEITRFELGDRITLCGALPQNDLAQCYLDHDLFVLASRYEGYGMAYGEAVLAGLPVIGTTAGAIPETVPKAASILVPPDDPAALSGAIRRVATDATLRAELAAGAKASADQFPTWPEVGKRFADCLEKDL